MGTSSYVIPYSILLKQVGLPADLDGDDRVQVTGDQIKSLIRKLMAAVPVDESWYRSVYQDIDQAIQSGKIKSAKRHFVADGYFEGRLPAKVVVDEAFYVSRYPDVAEGIDDGEINSAQEHFEAHGFSEGRLPFEV